MATKPEITKVLIFICVDLDVEFNPEKVNVWYEFLKDTPIQEVWDGARLLLTRKVFGKFPRVNDITEAIAELKMPTSTWGDDWDTWVQIARRWGMYQVDKCLTEYKEKCPMGYRALGTSAREYFTTMVEDMPVFKAQFRQRYEGLHMQQKNALTRPIGLRQIGNVPVLQIVSETTKKLGAN